MKKLFGQLAAAFGAKPTAETKPSPAAPSSGHGPSQAPFVAFQPHNEIERMLMEAATKPDARQAFQRELLDVDLYAAMPVAPDVLGAHVIPTGERISLLNVQGPNGVPVTAIFTAQERVVEVFGTGAPFIAMKGEALLELVASGGAWLNPGFPYSVHWTPSELATVLGRPVPRVITKETRAMLGTPAEPPAALIDSLKAILGNDSRIAEAWFALAHWAEDGKSSWYLDVRTDLERAVVLSLLADTFKRADYAGRPLDMIVNKPGGQQGVGIRIAPTSTH